MKNSHEGKKESAFVRAVVEQPFEAEALGEIERSLHGKLRARQLSEDFIRRCGEEALQKAVVEYLRAVDQGREIRNRDAFIVDAAFKRAIDELRRESRCAEATDVETVLETGRTAAPATEEIALGHLQVDELHEVIAALSPEQRQLLSLHYFERRSAADSAQLLHLSETSFRRRLKRTLGVLRRRLGVELPERDSIPAIEIGLAAWASLGGARVPISIGPLEQASSALAGARDHLARLIGGGDSDKVAAVLGGPAGKVAGSCAGAAVACVLGGVVGPGISGIVGGPDQADRGNRPVHVESVNSAERDSVRTAPSVEEAAPSPLPLADSARSGRAARKLTAKQSEARQLETQTSATARVARESETSQGAAVGSTAQAEPESVVVVPSESSPSPAQTTREETQAQQEFGAFR